MTKTNENLLSASELMFDSLNLTVPSCNKCSEACNGCKMKFLQKMSATI